MTDTASILLQDALRTLGYSLEAMHVRRVRLYLSDEGVRVELRSADGVRLYNWQDLRIQMQAMQRLRRPGGTSTLAADTWTFARWSVLLRVKGALLDLEGVRACRVDAAIEVRAPPQECQLRVTAGSEVIATTTAIQELLEALRQANRGSPLMEAAAPTAAERLAATRAALIARSAGRGWRRWWPWT